jgi:hypothetical protein
VGNYIFRFPADTPELSFDVLSQLVHEACGKFWRCSSCHLKIGTTVTVRWNTPADALIFRLYETDLAWIYPDRVAFCSTDHPSQATTEWLSRICQDNGIGYGVGRIPRHKADGQGPVTARGYAGLLVIEWTRERPVFGHSYPVDAGRQAAQRESRKHLNEYLAGV